MALEGFALVSLAFMDPLLRRPFFFACKGSKLNRAQCDEMLERYVDMALLDTPDLNHLTGEQKRAVFEMKKALKKSTEAYVKVEEQCEREVTYSQYRCTIRSENGDEWEACLH